MKKGKKFIGILVSLCMITALIPSVAFADTESPLPESTHDYENNYDNTWSYTEESAAKGVYVTFDEKTEVESGYDYLIVTDGNDKQVGKYTGTELAGKTLYVSTSTFKIRLTSDKSGSAYGFKVTSVDPVGEEGVDLSKVAAMDSIGPALPEAKPAPVVKINAGATSLASGDYDVDYSGNDTAGNTATITVTGKGKYTGAITGSFFIYDENHKAEPDADIEETNIKLRQTADWDDSLTRYSGASGYIPLENADDAYLGAIESVTLTPVDKDGSATDSKSLEYPKAPKKVTLGNDDKGTWAEKDGKWFVDGDNIYFYRTSNEPVVYVMENHEPIDISSRWGTTTYPQSQVYKVTVKAAGYEDIEGKVTYYTGTSSDFSIIIDEDGSADTTDDQKVAKSWSSKELKDMATYVNGSSQCGMTGFRTFSGEGVSLNKLLKDANVTVSETDAFLLDTSDHYGNEFTYEDLFGKTRYFLQSAYDDSEVAEAYKKAAESGDETTGENDELRRLLAKKAVEDNSIVEPRISVSYVETLLSGDNVGKTDVPTKDTVNYSDLVNYENQFRFIYGIALVANDEVTVNFDSQGGTEVSAQLVKSDWMTSTENTTIKSSYWANSLVIYRGAGETTDASDAVDKITAPENPVRDGYDFAGWYTDKECTQKFDFTANNGIVLDNEDMTLYAKWVEADSTAPGTDQNTNDGVSTGDDSMIGVLLALMLLAVATGVITFKRKKSAE